MFQKFGKEYDQGRMNVFLDALERKLSNDRRLYTFQVGSTATTNFNPDTDILEVPYTATGAATVNLPPVVGMVGRSVCVKDTGTAAVNNITINGDGAETIDGAATLVISTTKGKAWLFSDGAEWFVL